MTMLTRNQVEDRIERIVELEYNKLDRSLMNGLISQDEYNVEARAIDDWAREMYDEAWLKERV